MKTILLTGSNGQLGKTINEKFLKNYQILPFNHKELDISDEKKIENIVEKYKPDYIPSLLE